MSSSILALRRMPAVSTKRTGPWSVSTTVSTESRVVPGRSCTTTRSSPVRRLNSVDLPTLGRPTMATPRMRGSSSVASSGAASSLDSSGSMPTSRSSRSPVPRPCRALIEAGSPRPNDSSSQLAASCTRSSTLLATTITVSERPRSRAATLASSSVTPTVASTTNRTASAAAMAASLCRDTLSSRESPPTSQPPVSTSVNGRPCQAAATSLRSRVTPGRSSTIASRRPMIRFRSVDLPTLGRPTIATTGLMRGPPGGRRRRLPRPRRDGAGPRA